MKLSRLALAVALLPGVQVFAADAEQELPSMLITSARQAEPRAQATAANTVFTRADIERLQARSVPELLRRIPGVQVSSAGGLPSLSLRGTGTAQTLVLVDGQRIASATSGFARLDYLAIDNIERVEVIRGPRSSLYGADAIGGLIQIFTRGGKPGINPEVRLAAGSDQTFQRSLSLAAGTEQTRVHLGASLEERDGFDITRDNRGADRDNDGQRNKALHLKLDHQFDAGWKAGLSLNDQRGKNEYDDAYEFEPGTPQDEFRVSSYSGYLDGQLSGIWNSRLELGRSFDRNRAVGSNYNDGLLETTRHSAAWINRLQLSEHQQLSLGSDWYEDRLDATTAYQEDSRDNLAFFAQHSFQGESFSTELGLRHDDNQQFGSHNSWNAAFSLPVGQSQRWILSYGEGFRAPTFTDLYAPPAWGPNPDLKPETSKTYELQWRGEFDETQLEAALYRTDLEDMIAWGGTRMENVSQARINGFEASAARELLGWQASLGVSIIDPRDRDSGHTLARRAKRTLSIDLDRTFGALSAGAGWHVSSARYDTIANSRELSGYGIFDLRAAWQSHPELRWEAKVNNLFDRDYALATYDRSQGPNWFDPSQNYGYREAGRTLLFAVTWSPSL
ncbi:MAG: TonB-dependent receptor [Pseudomonas stutzeri]|jgi:vitamin B12 transporter|uniref:TonB-dependent receptor n=1 Tax=Stutzerimonas stutzeri TaxID=316 RepID=A0A4S2BCA7_STUST|nr:TonB-dependent receptor [Stutzerimonas stutzeri]AEA82696.1 TonB-dependent receptor, plug [Stutzerimonas stutzeri DSM 4166]MBO0643349.1 TonB-dependent receptor [Stutzerimonas stutzeri]MDH0118791.1 TonB-dependent receptor [Stutzerimonas stutzeri]MDH0147515.1 TonB-dependent receptor [Stutzerimonas stutzeri]MDH0151859.1 TonB-dependent receptor [Stutzerimonas stutzeri]